jgi:hypothetical protein
VTSASPPRELVQGVKGKTSGRELAIDLAGRPKGSTPALTRLSSTGRSGAAGLPIDTLNVEAHRNSS